VRIDGRNSETMPAVTATPTVMAREASTWCFSSWSRATNRRYTSFDKYDAHRLTMPSNVDMNAEKKPATMMPRRPMGAMS
jgi:hypothetical protein